MTLSYMSSADVYLTQNCIGTHGFQSNPNNKKRKSGLSQLLGTAATATAVILATQLNADAAENEIALSMDETFDTDISSENISSSMVDSDIHTASVETVLGSLNTVNQTSMIANMELASLTQVAAGIIVGQQSENSLPDGFVTQSPNVSDPSQSTQNVELSNAKADSGLATTRIQTGSAGSEHAQDGEGQTINARDGKDGIDGKDGRDGADGNDGISGLDGKDGQDGINGKHGIDGKDGSNGRDGEDGKNGVNGKDGSNGKDGTDGADGQDGADGENGINGLDGKDGTNGLNGKDGATGETGANGTNGTDGVDGKDGKDGLIHLVLDDDILANENFAKLIDDRGIDTLSTKNGLVVLTLSAEELVEVMNTLSSIDEFADLFNNTTEEYEEKFPDAGGNDNQNESSQEETEEETTNEEESNENTDIETNKTDDFIILNAAGGSASGEGGNDTFIASAGNDVIDGGSGNDTVNYSNSTDYVEVELDTNRAINGYAEGDTLTTVENIIGSEFADVLGGNADSNLLMGGKGDDFIYGLEGNDIFEGGEGDDYIDGGDGDLDTAIYINSDEGVYINLEYYEATGGHADGDYLESIEAVTGSSHDDHLVGDFKDNRLGGRHGEDVLFGGDGNDTLLGGGGMDIIDGGEGIDTADYTASIAGVQVNLSDGTTKYGEAEGDTLTSIENLAGSSLNDIFFGNDEANRLTGRDGNDTLDGGKGNDNLIGGADNDTLTGGEGNDVFIFKGDTGTDTITDFEAGEGRTDRLWLQDNEFASFEEVQLAMNETNEGTTLSFEHGEILFQDVQSSEFVADDFILA